ncbi:MAG: response regulator transcription factor [Xanthobacteraceae bacterium]
MLSELQRGRELYGRHSWAEAFKSLSQIDRTAPLGVHDLELLATAAYLIGRDDEYLKTLERAHHAYLDADNGARAARCAFWLGLRLMFRGEMGPATGWFGRARRVLEQHAQDCVEQGYLMLPLVEQKLRAGEDAAAYGVASEAAAIGSRFGDADLVAIALHLQGRALLRQQKVEPGLALLDEAMVAVTAGELSPIVTGLIYCSVIEACQQVYAMSRAGEWTTALARWCAEQPELVAFTDRCLVHRSEIMQLRGDWDGAIAEAQRACTRFAQKDDQRISAEAYYQQGEIHRLRGDYDAADAAYRNASQWGWEPQPGLALLRLAQGRTEAAAAAIRRVVGAAKDPFQRMKLLPAYVEIMLAIQDYAEARSAAAELQTIAARYGSDILRAFSDYARGTVDLAEENAKDALASLQRARAALDDFDAPYWAACARAHAARACRALGDDEAADLELSAARAAFARLGAEPDVARLDAAVRDGSGERTHGLTARELQVLRLLTSGKTNKVIARDLTLSEKTVDRHVSNILNKLDVPSRAAATAYAYQHKLI